MNQLLCLLFLVQDITDSTRVAILFKSHWFALQEVIVLVTVRLFFSRGFIDCTNKGDSVALIASFNTGFGRLRQCCIDNISQTRLCTYVDSTAFGAKLSLNFYYS